MLDGNDEIKKGALIRTKWLTLIKAPFPILGFD